MFNYCDIFVKFWLNGNYRWVIIYKCIYIIIIFFFSIFLYNNNNYIKDFMNFN